ncbi:MAG: TolC family protein [Gemmatales bacterium]|nr:TolC family protein [Gemmatales bacterium]MDW8386101.1 TolC family protein [Gemmatales bacterium]
MVSRKVRLFSMAGLAAGVLMLTVGNLPTAAQEPSAAPAHTIRSLEEAVKVALDRQPNVQAARQSLNAAIVARESANSSLSILAGPIAHVRRKQADLGVAIAQANLEEAELQTVHAVTRSYLTVIYAQDQLKVATEFSDRMKRLRDSTENSLKAGSKFVKEADLDRIDTYALVAQARRTEAEHGIARAKAGLREAIGVGCDVDFDFSSDTLDKYYESVTKHCAKHAAEFCSKKCTETALCHRPETNSAALFAVLANLEIEAQSLSLHPQVKTFAAYADIHAAVIPATRINGTYQPGGLAQEMPIFLAGHRSARMAQAAQLANRAAAVRDKFAGLIALEVEDACQRLKQEEGQIKLLRQAVEKAEKNVENGRAAYTNQQGGIDDWLEAEGVAAQIRGQLNEALFRYAAALASLQKATAGKMYNCLKPVEEGAEKLAAPQEAKP